MKRKSAFQAETGEDAFGLILCVIFFLGGVFIGTFTARALDDAGTWALYHSISGYIYQIADGTYVPPNFFSVLWSTGRYHFLVLFLGFSLLGVLCLPVVSGLQGFYLSFSIAAFIRAFGMEGWPMAFSLFGLGALITVPSFLLLASQAFSSSLQLGKAGLGAGKLYFGSLYSKGYFMRALLCLAGILAAVLLELYLTPSLVTWVESIL